MAKILLVEDDNNLREIYEARLQAEGYTIVSAKDGEEALVLAKGEHPDLIISDVMMPRVSGFEMLDILRNTEGLKDTKIIMLTALGQAEDKTRADSLGADRYLVKSQVTLEDIVKTAQELLVEAGVMPAIGAAPATNDNVTPVAAPAPAAAVTPAPTAPSRPAVPPAPRTAPISVATPPRPVTTPAVTAAVPVAAPPNPATPAVPPVAATPPAPAPEPTAPASSQQTQAAQPSAPTPQAAPAAPAPAPAPAAPEPKQDNAAAKSLTQTASSEEAAMQAQISNFINQPEPTQPAATPAAPAPAAETPVEQPAAPAATPPTEPTPEPPAVPPATPTPTQPPQPPVVTPAPVVVTPTPQAVDNDLVADAVKNLSTPPAPAVPPAPEQAPVAPVETPAAPAPQPSPENDAVTVAHKKIIKPISDPTADTKPDLNELLAREGVNSIDDVPQPQHPAIPAQPATSTNYSTPHPPGHVITPNGGGVDPNSIAL